MIEFSIYLILVCIDVFCLQYVVFKIIKNIKSIFTDSITANLIKQFDIRN